MSKPDRAVSYDGNQIQQRPDELVRFVQLVVGNGVRRYLEIGLRFGYTFFEIGKNLPPASFMVGVDLVEHRNLKQSVMMLRKKGHSVADIFGDSKDKRTMSIVRRYAPYDLVFIDGGHDYETALSDWKSYGPMSRLLVAFHDIDCDAEGYGVHKLWKELKASGKYETQEIIGEARGMGIGVLWKPKNGTFSDPPVSPRSFTDEEREVAEKIGTPQDPGWKGKRRPWGRKDSDD